MNRSTAWFHCAVEVISCIDCTESQFMPTIFFSKIVSTASGKSLELWTNDGSPEGSHLVKVINPSVLNPYDVIEHITPYHGGAVFWASDGPHGAEPWFSDGTPTGTFMLKDINPTWRSRRLRISPMSTAPCSSRPRARPVERNFERPTVLPPAQSSSRTFGEGATARGRTISQM